jgi:hypothetical protein
VESRPRPGRTSLRCPSSQPRTAQARGSAWLSATGSSSNGITEKSTSARVRMAHNLMCGCRLNRPPMLSLSKTSIEGQLKDRLRILGQRLGDDHNLAMLLAASPIILCPNPRIGRCLKKQIIYVAAAAGRASSRVEGPDCQTRSIRRFRRRSLGDVALLSQDKVSVFLGGSQRNAGRKGSRASGNKKNNELSYTRREVRDAAAVARTSINKEAAAAKKKRTITHLPEKDSNLSSGYYGRLAFRSHRIFRSVKVCFETWSVYLTFIKLRKPRQASLQGIPTQRASSNGR